LRHRDPLPRTEGVYRKKYKNASKGRLMEIERSPDLPFLRRLHAALAWP
jgi:hypothetical protein